MNWCGWGRSSGENRKFGHGVSFKVAQTFLIACPREWCNFIVELRKTGPMESGTLRYLDEICGSFEGLNGREFFNTCFLEGVCSNRFVDLPVPCVSAVDWFERNELGWVWRQIGCMFLFFPVFLVTMFKFIGCTF